MEDDTTASVSCSSGVRGTGRVVLTEGAVAVLQ